MPLRDHFHPPMSDVLDWTSVHAAWATFLAVELNQHLPAGYYAAPQTKFGIEIDVAALDVRRNGSPPSSDAEPAQVSVPVWPTAPTLTLTRRSLTDEVGVRIYAGGPRRMLVGAIELVSPSNKDRASAQNSLLTKCLDILRFDAGLILVDVVTERHFNFHQELINRWEGPQEPPFGANLYAGAYRPIPAVRTEDGNGDEPSRLEAWVEPLTIGRPIPTLPLWLLGVGPIGVKFEATYERTLRELRFAD